LATSPKGPWIDQSYGPSLGFAVNSLKENWSNPTPYGVVVDGARGASRIPSISKIDPSSDGHK
jgi:hypothetical protein